MRFVLFVEGHTERAVLPAFLKRWLDPQLEQPIGIKVVRFEGWRDYVKEIGKKVALNLSGKAGADVVAAIGLLDLHGPDFYPDNAGKPAQRYRWAKAYLEEIVDNTRFRQHFAVHELEAWLQAEPGIFPRDVAGVLSNCATQPEDVNFSEPPSMLLDRVYRERLGRAYAKVVDGSNLFQVLDPSRAFDRCPYLQQLLQDMLRLASAGGS